VKEHAIDSERTIVTHNQTTEIAQPIVGVSHDPSPKVSSQASAILGYRLNAILFARADPFDPRMVAIALWGSLGPPRQGQYFKRDSGCALRDKIPMRPSQFGLCSPVPS